MLTGGWCGAAALAVRGLLVLISPISLTGGYVNDSMNACRYIVILRGVSSRSPLFFLFAKGIWRDPYTFAFRHHRGLFFPPVPGARNASVPSPPQQQWPLDSTGELHVAAGNGSVEGTLAVLSMGVVGVDEAAPDDSTPLVLALSRATLALSESF